MGPSENMEIIVTIDDNQPLYGRSKCFSLAEKLTSKLD